jgi:hypothetical protein
VTTALIACGAFGRELLALKQKHGWDADVLGISVLLHNRPERIPEAVRERIREARSAYERVVVVYGDCGTGGQLDELLEREGVERIAGPHCYEIYGGATFERLMEEDLGTYFLTDFLVRSFDHLVIKGLGLDRFPQLRDDYFGNYRRVVYLAQRNDPDLLRRAERAAAFLGLPLEVRPVGYGDLESRLIKLMAEDRADDGDDVPGGVLAGHSSPGEGAIRPEPGGEAALRSLPGRD